MEESIQPEHELFCLKIYWLLSANGKPENRPLTKIKAGLAPLKLIEED